MTGTEIYKRTPAYDREARDIRLLAPHWKLLLAFDGQRTLSEVALSAETSFADSLPVTQKFLDKNWIEETPITLDQYMKRLGTKDISNTGALIPPPIVLHDPKKDAPAPAVPAPPSPGPAASPPALSVYSPATPKPLISPTATGTIPPPLPVAPAPPAKPPESASTPAPAKDPRVNRSPMKMNAVVDFITSLVGNISLGQILVYRVFLRVPPELLLAEDVASVHLANDTSLIKGEKLQKAIREAVEAVTKRSLPDSVFATA